MADLSPIDPSRKQSLPPADHSRVGKHKKEAGGSEEAKEPQKLPRELREQFPTYLARKVCEFYGWFTGSSTRQITAVVKELEASREEESKVTVAEALKNVLVQPLTECGAEQALEELGPFFGEKGIYSQLFAKYSIDFTFFVHALCDKNPSDNLKLEKGLFRDLVYSFFKNFCEETERVVKGNAPFERKMLELHRLLQLKPQKSESQNLSGFDAFKCCAAFLKEEDGKTFLEKHDIKSVEDFGTWAGRLEDAEWIDERLRASFDDKTILEAILDYQDSYQGHTVVQLLGMLSNEARGEVEAIELASLGEECTESNIDDPKMVCGPAWKGYIRAALTDLLDSKD